jgi:5-hydroxyisourate hydrolase-like protein (transthyretin family)
MPGISIHVVDVSRGMVASGMRVEVFRGEHLIATGAISSKGLLESDALGAKLAPFKCTPWGYSCFRGGA